MNGRWRCGLRFATSPDAIRAGRWRICARPWGHWASRVPARRRHEGPLMSVQPKGDEDG